MHGNLDLTNILVDCKTDQEDKKVHLVGFNKATNSESTDDKAVDLKIFSINILNQDKSLSVDSQDSLEYFDTFQEGYKSTSADHHQTLHELATSRRV